MGHLWRLARPRAPPPPPRPPQEVPPHPKVPPQAPPRAHPPGVLPSPGPPAQRGWGPARLGCWSGMGPPPVKRRKKPPPPPATEPLGATARVPEAGQAGQGEVSGGRAAGRARRG